MAYAEQQIEKFVTQTKKWIRDVVVGCNFCPFAAKEFKGNTIHFQVEDSTDRVSALRSFLKECERLDEDETIVTTLLLFPEGFSGFESYLDLVERAESLLDSAGYEGTYQVASFHPQYLFAGAPANDPANYTNRSPYPMLHLLREDQITAALSRYPHPEQIPDRNIEYARAKGEAYMRALFGSCLAD